MSTDIQGFLDRRSAARAKDDSATHAGRLTALEQAMATRADDARDIRGTLAALEQGLAALRDTVEVLTVAVEEAQATLARIGKGKA